MLKTIRKGLLILFLLLSGLGGISIILLNPRLFYPFQTRVGPVRVFHHEPLDPGWVRLLERQDSILQTNPLYPETNWKSDLCLDQHTAYPRLVRTILGDDVIRAFAHKMVILSSQSHFGTLEKWDSSLPTDQWIRHALIHNFQYRYHGFWQANPLGRHPNWKWEGYAEYASIGHAFSLKELWDIYQQRAGEPYELVSVGKKYRTVNQHVKYLILTKYCIETVDMDYPAFMQDKQTETLLWSEIESLMGERTLNQGK